MIDKFTKIFKPQALQGGGGHYGPHEFSLVALKRQKILGLPNASMIINSSSLQLLWRKKSEGTTFNGVMVSRQKSKVVGSLQPAEPVLLNRKSTKMRFFMFQ